MDLKAVILLWEAIISIHQYLSFNVQGKRSIIKYEIGNGPMNDYL